MSQRKTHEQHLAELAIAHEGRIVATGIYKGAHEKIGYRCIVCEHDWQATPNMVTVSRTTKGKLRQPTGCARCAGRYKYKPGEYREEVFKRSDGKIKCLGDYVTSKKPIAHQCTVCDHVWDTKPNLVLTGHGCPACYTERQQNGYYAKAHEQYLQDVEKVHGDLVEVLGQYQNSKTPIQHRCGECGDVWEVSPSGILSGSRHPACSRRWIAREKIKKSAETYENRLQQIRSNNYTLVGKYQGSKVKTLHKCNMCQHEWMIKPNLLLTGKGGCPACAPQRWGMAGRLTEDEFRKQISGRHGEAITPLETYTKSDKPMRFLCNECGYEWQSIASSILTKSGCPECAIRKNADARRRSQQEYEREIRKIHGSNITATGEYVNAHTAIMHLCNECGHEWIAPPQRIINAGQGCAPCKGRMSDTVYIWEANDQPGLFKIGVTSWNFGRTRIDNVARSFGGCKLIIRARFDLGKATDYERLILEMGVPGDVGNVSGRTEFRHLQAEQIEKAVELLRDNALEVTC